MLSRVRRIAISTLLAACLAPVASAATWQTSAGPVTVTEVVAGLSEPWAVTFLPDGSQLVTERSGRLLHLDGGRLRAVSGVPRVVDAGQGGLLDVVAARDFAETQEIFLSFAMQQGRGSGTALAVAKLSDDARRLERVRVIFEMTTGSSGGRHFGSRVVEGRDGTLFLTIGDRGDRASAQDLMRHNGAVIRVNRDGSIPHDNPFVGRGGAEPEIWSYGHRNPQGAALDASGALWSVEHGARGGDEINRIARGANFGWPVISYGRHYSGARIGEGTSMPGMEQPAHYWDPSIAPSGMMIYSGKLWPEWAGDIFVGSLKFGLISRLEGTPLREVERLQEDETARVRDIREAPDGSIWFLSVGQGALYRMVPAEGA